MSEEKKKAPNLMSERTFLKALAGAAIIAAGTIVANKAMKPTAVIAAQQQPKASVPPAKGRISGDPTLCTGCGLCELVCSTYNDGVANPELSRLRVSRLRHIGLWDGTALFTPEVCYQCVEPACLNECRKKAQDAIKVDEEHGTLARVIDEEKCLGECIDICREACPWKMPALNPKESPSKSYGRPGSPFQSPKGGKLVAIKCNLCWGNPRCVEFCPTGALKILYS